MYDHWVFPSCSCFSLQMTNSAERSLFAIFVCISAMFLVCHFPRGILNILEFQGRIREQRMRMDGRRAIAPLSFLLLQLLLLCIIVVVDFFCRGFVRR